MSAIQLARLIAPHRSEPVMALVFGLIHGFGFVRTLGALGLKRKELFLATLGVNIGIEIAQLAADLVIAPLLSCLARSPTARYAVAIPAAIVAVGWIVQRTVGTTNPLEPAVAFLAGIPECLTLTALAAIAAVIRCIRRRDRQTRPPGAQTVPNMRLRDPLGWRSLVGGVAEWPGATGLPRC